MPEQPDGQAPTRSVRGYLDESPVWPDGTPAGDPPLTGMQKRIWVLAAAGKFFEGLVVFMTGVALPLIHEEFALSPLQNGMVGAATLFGILIGATALGGLADRFGRKSVFIGEMVLFCLFLVALTFSPGFIWLVLFLFGIGVALGGDYPTAHLIISESIPSRVRGRLVLSAFGFQSLGALAGTGIGYLILSNLPEIGAWRWMYATAIVPALIVVIGRLAVTESPAWLLTRGRHADAEKAATRLLRRKPQYPRSIRLHDAPALHAGEHRGGYGTLFAKGTRRATILAAVPWFLQDLGTYGIGIFTPTILALSLGHAKAHDSNVSDLIVRDIQAAEGAAFLDILLIVGILAAVLLADRVGRIRLQVIGFAGCAVGLLLAALSGHIDGPGQTALLFAGFMLFNFMTNMGPNAQTYLIAGEVFPTRMRGTGAGFAASFAKIGAVATVFLFPILLHGLGTDILLGILIGTSLLGAWVTWRFRIETAGVSLETVKHHSD
jgi:MFS transporter, putative metabolite transport protein